MEYTEPRATKDLDILIACNQRNAKKVFSALKEFGASLSGISESFFAKKGRFYKMGRPPSRIDIITSAEGATFSEIWRSKNMRQIGETNVPFIGIKELIKLKKAAGRMQDLIDLKNLKVAVQLEHNRRKPKKKG